MVLTKTPICSFEEKAHNFNLKGVDNKFYKLKNCVGIRGIIIMFICNHCQYVKEIIKDLVEDMNDLKKNALTEFLRENSFIKLAFLYFLKILKPETRIKSIPEFLS